MEAELISINGNYIKRESLEKYIQSDSDKKKNPDNYKSFRFSLVNDTELNVTEMK